LKRTYRKDAFDLVTAVERALVSRIAVQAKEHVHQVLSLGGVGTALAEVAVDDLLVERVELIRSSRLRRPWSASSHPSHGM